MTLAAAALNTLAQAFATAYPWLSIHTTGTETTSTGESTAARVAAGWVVSGAAATATNKAFTGGAANGPATRVGYWSAATGGTFGGSETLVGDTTFNAAGEYTVTSVSETGAAT